MLARTLFEILILGDRRPKPWPGQPYTVAAQAFVHLVSIFTDLD